MPKKQNIEKCKLITKKMTEAKDQINIYGPFDFETIINNNDKINADKKKAMQKIIDKSFDLICSYKYRESISDEPVAIPYYKLEEETKKKREAEEKKYKLKDDDDITLFDCLNSNTFLKLIDKNLELKNEDPELETFIKNALSSDGENKQRIERYKNIFLGKLPVLHENENPEPADKFNQLKKILQLDQIQKLNNKVNIKDYGFSSINNFISRFENACKIIRGEKGANKKATCLNLSNTEEFFTTYFFLLAIIYEIEAVIEDLEEKYDGSNFNNFSFTSKIKEIEQSWDENFFEFPDRILNKLTQDELKECGITDKDKKEKLKCKDLSLGQLSKFYSLKFKNIGKKEFKNDSPAITQIVNIKNQLFEIETYEIFKRLIAIKQENFFKSLYEKEAYDDNDFKQIELILKYGSSDFKKFMKINEKFNNKNLSPRKKIEGLYNEYKEHSLFNSIDNDLYYDLICECENFDKAFEKVVVEPIEKENEEAEKKAKADQEAGLLVILPAKKLVFSPFYEIQSIIWDFESKSMLKNLELNSKKQSQKEDFPAQKIRDKLDEFYKEYPGLKEAVFEAVKKMGADEFLSDTCLSVLESVKELKEEEKESNWLYKSGLARNFNSIHDDQVDKTKKSFKSIKAEAIKDLLLDVEALDKSDDKNIFAMNKWIYGEEIAVILSNTAKIKRIVFDEKTTPVEKENKLKELNIDIAKTMQDYAGLFEKYIVANTHGVPGEKTKELFDDFVRTVKDSGLTPGAIKTFFIIIFDVISLLGTGFIICAFKPGRSIFKELIYTIRYGRKNILTENLKTAIEKHSKIKSRPNLEPRSQDIKNK